MSRFSSVGTAVALLFFTGCATIGGGRGPERIAIESDPSSADVRIECAGQLIGTGVTPASISVPRSLADCLVTVTHQGYESQTVALEQGFSQRYWGNIYLVAALPVAVILAFSGSADDTTVVGLLALGGAGTAGLITDSVTDARHDHDPKAIRVTLKAIAANEQ